MADLKALNNQHQLDIARAALTHITFGNKYIRKLMRDYLGYLSKICADEVGQEWVDSHSGLIAGDWKHFKTYKEE